ncbi:putative low-affinity inorganic phosphate transporter [Candidatus Sulfotelmatobacter kueseliae]|uniref:Putative low-affinity inorganic phosphate transporter n=1 Tax=Candidatus Sulfotelmatobacter kueseliae TaxID=2042962 RepID=A0A2U3KV75_9BACT|nr:putative low-affinity inorganic phosphate transporter [Candidatus Sulfotelmatobacter kueseliae]
MKPEFLLLIITLLVALTFDFLNGFHDAANSIATVVSTRVLSPRLAVVWAAFFNFVAAFMLGTAVAKTIGSGMIRIDFVTQYVVIAGLLGAIVWDLLTWWWGLPTSSSHALIGGMAGAAILRAGWRVIIVAGWYKTLIFIVVAPIMGLTLSFGFMVAVFWILRNKAPQRIDAWFRRLQLLSAAAYSLGHGGNDAQKTMGIVASALYGAKILTASQLAGSWGHYHWPIILAAHTSIALGTYFGGWRIVHTMGTRITKLRPVGGFCAETAGAITLFATALAGIPVSTTHTITGAIVGVGATHRLSAVRWGVATRIVWAWVMTIPASAAVAALAFWLIRLIHPAA